MSSVLQWRSDTVFTNTIFTIEIFHVTKLNTYIPSRTRDNWNIGYVFLGGHPFQDRLYDKQNIALSL